MLLLILFPIDSHYTYVSSYIYIEIYIKVNIINYVYFVIQKDVSEKLINLDDEVFTEKIMVGLVFDINSNDI